MKRFNLDRFKIHSEMSEEVADKWFTYTKDKFINHIDTLYYVVYPAVQNWNEDEKAHKFIDFLRSEKEKAQSDGKARPIFGDIDKRIEMKPYMGFQMYSLHFGIDDSFDVFVMPSMLNDKTPPVFVQIRSFSLWLDGTNEAFGKSADVVAKVLDRFGIEIDRVQENRVDYAFHTNRIQDLLHFFPEKDLIQMQVSDFERSGKQYYFRQDEIFSDYFTLGRRTSNNIFFRVYDKTKEVIEMGYKQFFIHIWLKYGLISKFDEFVLKRTFTYGTYNSKERARCEFYYIYGSDFAIKQDIKELLSNPGTPYQSYKKIADMVVPDVTTVVNIEFQTKRKYYDRLEMPELSGDTSFKANMYNLFLQHKSIIRRLTTDTLRFVKYKGKFAELRRSERPMSDWWERLQKSKSIDIQSDEWLVDYIRKEQNNLDFERLKTAVLSKVSSTGALLMPQNDGTLITDFVGLLSYVNDNDIEKYRQKREQKLKELEKRGLI